MPNLRQLDIQKNKNEERRLKNLANPVLQAKIKTRKEKRMFERQQRMDKSQKVKDRVFSEINNFNTNVMLHKNALKKEAPWRGKYILNAGENSFSSCYEKEKYFLTGSQEVMGQIKQAFKNLFRKEGTPVFLSVLGQSGPNVKGGDYRGTLVVNKVRRSVRLNKFDCGDYYGRDSLDIHPTWLKRPKKCNCWCYLHKN